MAQPLSVGKRASAEFLHDKHVLSSSADLKGQNPARFIIYGAAAEGAGLSSNKRGNN
jgi:hypothetical protein